MVLCLRQGIPGKTAKSKVAALRLKADGEFLSFMVMNELKTVRRGEACSLRRPWSSPRENRVKNGRGQCGKSLM
jgi:hypothetical protein